MTRLVRSLKIPCVVVGVGLRCELDQDPLDDHPFDQDVRDFLVAVLERSANVGLRGHTTAAYLTHLGFKEGEHFRVIGCPSMYWNGAVLPRRDLTISDDMHINVTMNVYTEPIGNGFLLKILRDYPNSVYTSQSLNELKTLYLAKKYAEFEQVDTPEVIYPRHISDEVYVQNRVRLFLSVHQWMDALADMDLSIGGRMHGNVVAIQAGCPAVFIVKDRRMSELVEFHRLPAILRNELDDAWTLEEFLAHIDRDSMYAVHDANFANYVSFLSENGLEHIFSENAAPTAGSTPFDRAVAGVEQAVPVSAAGISAEALAMRWGEVLDEETAYRKELANLRVAAERADRDRAVCEAIEHTVAEMKLPRRIARKFGLR